MKIGDLLTAVSVGAAAVAVARSLLAPGPVLGGWKTLARSYGVDQLPAGERFRFVSARIGNELAPVLYRHVLNVVVSTTGLGISIQSVFGTPPAIFVPWIHVSSATNKRSWLGDAALFRVRDQWATIAVYGKAGSSALHAYQQIRPIRV